MQQRTGYTQVRIEVAAEAADEAELAEFTVECRTQWQPLNASAPTQ